MERNGVNRPARAATASGCEQLSRMGGRSTTIPRAKGCSGRLSTIGIDPARLTLVIAVSLEQGQILFATIVARPLATESRPGRMRMSVIC
jgi:hypothetical protein